eukprot:9503870-Pyramimonas_sp.AAC.2
MVDSDVVDNGGLERGGTYNKLFRPACWHNSDRPVRPSYNVACYPACSISHQIRADCVERCAFCSDLYPHVVDAVTLLAMLLAAAMHDAGHVGVTNGR